MSRFNKYTTRELDNMSVELALDYFENGTQRSKERYDRLHDERMKRYKEKNRDSDRH